MIFGYFKGSLSFAISTNSGSAAFLTDSAALANGRTGDGATFSFSSGTAILTRYTSIDVTMTSDWDATPPWGVVGLANVQGVAEGTKCEFNGVTQRLVRDAWGELSAWWLPSGVTGASKSIRIYNDVDGVASITPGATVFVGEVFAGRVLSLPTLMFGTPSSDLQDQGQSSRSRGGQLRQLLATPFDVVSAKLGLFSTNDARGGTASSIVSGANPAGVIDVQTLRRYIDTTPVCAVCDMPNAGKGDGSAVNGIRYSQSWIARNFMLARPLTTGQIAMDQAPYLSWSGLQFQRAS